MTTGPSLLCNMTPSRCDIHTKGLYPSYSSISFSASVNFIHKIAPPVRNVVTYIIWIPLWYLKYCGYRYYYYYWDTSSPSFKLKWSHAQDFLRITNSSDHVRVWTANLHAMHLWNYTSGNCISCKKFAVWTLLWSLKFMFMKKSWVKTYQNVIIITTTIAIFYFYNHRYFKKKL